MKKILSTSFLLKAAAVLAAAGVLIYINREYIQLSPEEIERWVGEAGVWAPLVFVVLYTVRPLILFPASVLSLAGGLMFGALFGTLLIVTGATAGAVLSFIVAKRLGKNIAGKEWKGRGRELQHQLERNGFVYVLMIRLIPIFNFDMISYLCGVSKVKLKAFFFGTLLGIIPGAFAYAFLGASVMEGSIQLIAGAAAVFIAVSAIPFFFRKKIAAKTMREADDS
ncbi:TVP38/TMEM64 family protein [Alkalicoccus luteus]|uniref:TVP38/TMEM64 family membrane protein n=1 Tax=Alkalicoccus luteus TaxID=1237094 RepID=A0A969PRJ0_9BACI|nr:TVP38/TMEM64 family protein [Alkalicoccus luteus]NJP36648.1 TVP38/TMEM64 family protein [Alkalicoccus luteus]